MDEESQQTKGQEGVPDKAKNQSKSGSSVSNTPRKRVSQACDRCRSRKDKCDGKKPVCSTCAALDQVCSYDPATKKRGLPEGYVRGLEKLWGLTIRDADGVEETVLNMLNGGEEGQESEALVKKWNDQEGTETLLEIWRKSLISRELERLLPILDSAEEKLGKRKRPESGSARLEGGTAVSLPLPQPSDMDHKLSDEALYWNPGDSPAAPSFHDPQRRRVEASWSRLGLPSKTELPSRVELPLRAWQLLDVFFSYTHCWLPIIEKHDLLRTSYKYSQGGIESHTSMPGSGDHAVLWAVLAYAEFQHNAITRRDPRVDAQWTVDNMYDHARDLIPTEQGAFEVGHIQALLVLVLLKMGMDHWSQAWLLVGQAARIAVSLGIDEDPSWSQQDKSIDRRSRSKHVFLGCFVLDTIIAARLGRKPQLRKEDADRVGLVEEDGPDEWNPWVDCLAVRRSAPDGLHGPTALLSTFNRFVLLFKILNSAICDGSSGRERVEHCTQMLRELDAWGQVLPTLLDPSSKPPLLPHRFHLHLAHISTMAAVYSHLSSCSKQMQISDSTVAETFATTARQTMWLLLRQSEGFGLLIVPPTYEYFTKIACESAIKVQDSLTDAHLTYKDWQQNMERLLITMETAWPAFKALRKSLPTEPPDPVYRYQSHPATGMTRGESFDIAQHIPALTKFPSAHDNIFTFPGGFTSSPLIAEGNSPQDASAFQRSGFNPLFNTATSGGLHSVEGSSPTWPDPASGQNPFIDQPSADQLQFRTGSLGSDIDGDSIFNDLATLDAMEWTNNWDQSLLNLGFTDPDNMNQDFYAFCREPDPLYSNNLVQQLLSSTSNTGSGSGGAQLVVGDFSLGETGIGFENPHIEAGHILHALSTAQAHGAGQGLS